MELNSQQMLKTLIAKVLRIDKENIDTNKDLTHYGVGSLVTLVLLGEINSNFNVNLTPEELTSQFTINQLTKLIAGKTKS